MSVISSTGDQNQTYELYAVVDHLGDLRSGCYTATIKDDESWYRFNDDKVTLVRLITLTTVLLNVSPKPLCCTVSYHSAKN